MFKLLKSSIYWTLILIYYAGIILAAGTFLGGVAFLVFGPLTSTLPMDELFKKGAWAGVRYAGVWALGLSIILCFMRGKRMRDNLNTVR